MRNPSICGTRSTKRVRRQRTRRPSMSTGRSLSRWPSRAGRKVTSFGGLRRSDLMSRIRSTANATTELVMARLLKRRSLAGWRRHLPLAGRPDFAWPKKHVALFVDGCFWHGHVSCHKNITPSTNAQLWRTKIEGNRRRDIRVARRLRGEGWRVLRVWECTLTKRPAACVARVRRALDRGPGRAAGRWTDEGG